MMITRRRGFDAAARGLTLAALVIVLCACQLVWKPPLRVHCVRGGVILDVQTLGEYQTSISRIRIVDSHGETVWEVEARARIPQLHEVSLHCGSNPVRIPEFDEFGVVVPTSSDSFVLKSKEDYTAEVWGRNMMMRSRASFSIGHC